VEEIRLAMGSKAIPEHAVNRTLESEGVDGSLALTMVRIKPAEVHEKHVRFSEQVGEGLRRGDERTRLKLGSDGTCILVHRSTYSKRRESIVDTEEQSFFIVRGSYECLDEVVHCSWTSCVRRKWREKHALEDTGWLLADVQQQLTEGGHRRDRHRSYKDRGWQDVTIGSGSEWQQLQGKDAREALLGWDPHSGRVLGLCWERQWSAANSIDLSRLLSNG